MRSTLHHGIRSAALVALVCGASACNESKLDALPSAHTEYHFQGAETPPVDVLFVVDNSGSMQQEQEKLGANFEAFIQHFTNLGLDFQLAVVTTDTSDPNESGKFQGTPAIITPETPQFSRVFLENVAVGTDGSGAESGLEAARLAFSEPVVSTDNIGFLRPDAILAIIIVSDEEDGSDGDDGEPDPQDLTPVDEYVNFFLALKDGNPSKVVMPVIVGDVPGGCQSDDATAEPGVRYHEVANALNGSKSSICGTSEEFSSVLDEIGSQIAGLVTAFPLDYTPDLDSIQVKVDGVVVPRDPMSGWYWDTAIGGIAFAPAAVPPACAVIEISYGVEDFGGPLEQGNAEAPPEECPVELPSFASNSLEGGYFACSVGVPGGTAGVGTFVAGGALLLMMALRRRRDC